MAESLTDQSLLSKQIASNEADAKESSEDRVRALEKILNLSEQLHGNNKFDGKTVGQMKRDLAVIVELKKEELDASEKRTKFYQKTLLKLREH